MSLGRDLTWKRHLVRMLPDAKAPVCVDLACGTGDVALKLAARFPAGRIQGIDLTPAMLSVARTRCRFNNVSSRVGDMCATGLEDASVDFVTGSYALRNAPILDDALREVHRILKPGGHAAFLDFTKSPGRLRQKLQLLLLKFWGGMWGILIHGGPEHAYISESLRQFPDRAALRVRVAYHGFTVAETRPCFGGMLEILVLRKQQPSSGA
jgi:demethylmenaquinone methyltransferase/2-methoxy-6-polyprenyl-1,4-benzoquinol methylase